MLILMLQPSQRERMQSSSGSSWPSFWSKQYSHYYHCSNTKNHLKKMQRIFHRSLPLLYRRGLLLLLLLHLQLRVTLAFSSCRPEFVLVLRCLSVQSRWRELLLAPLRCVAVYCLCLFTRGVPSLDTLLVNGSCNTE